MHDIADLEARGIPGGFIASSEFEQAAKAQEFALGMAPKRVFVQHPIQDRTDDQMLALADGVFDDIIAMVQQ
jgi:hypothetical protein